MNYAEIIQKFSNLASLSLPLLNSFRHLLVPQHLLHYHASQESVARSLSLRLGLVFRAFALPLVLAPVQAPSQPLALRFALCCLLFILRIYVVQFSRCGPSNLFYKVRLKYSNLSA